MFTTFNLADHVLAVSFNKEVDNNAAGKFRELVKKRLETFNCINLYFEVENKKSITLNAFLEDLSFHYKHAENIGKIAVVSDNFLLQKSMDLKDLFMRPDIKTFGFEDRIKVMNWIINKISQNPLEI